jgi:hypothetical protein
VSKQNKTHTRPGLAFLLEAYNLVGETKTYILKVSITKYYVTIRVQTECTMEEGDIKCIKDKIRAIILRRGCLCELYRPGDDGML